MVVNNNIEFIFIDHANAVANPTELSTLKYGHRFYPLTTYVLGIWRNGRTAPKTCAHRC